MKNKKHIDFLGIGVQKSGTSWLFNNLEKIPEFDLLPIKEIHYFDRNNLYPSSSELTQTFFWKRIINPKYFYRVVETIWKNIMKKDFKRAIFFVKWYFSNYTDRWYISLFRNLNGYKGEITPSYSILNENDIRRIENLFPKIKLVLILRNPIDRAWSQYRFSTRKWNNFSFENVPHDRVIKFMESEGQSLRSDYIRTINNYSKIFSKEQILICFFDAIYENPKTLMKDILKHICGDESFSMSHLNLQKKINKSRQIDCPKEIEDYLKNRYHDQIKELSEKYGSYFTKWYEESYGEKSTNENRKLLPTMYI